MTCCGQCIHRETVDIDWKEFECGLTGKEIESLTDRCESFVREEAGPMVRCIIKRPDEPYGRMTTIPSTLRNLQHIVGGYIECVPLYDDVVIVCNEDGKLLELEPNVGYRYGDVLCGTIIVIGIDEEGEFEDVKVDFDWWQDYVTRNKLPNRK